MIRLLIVDDQEIVRVGLRHILADYSFIEIVGEAANGETAIRLNRQLLPHVVLLDVALPGLSGLEITRRLKQARPGLHVLVISATETAPFPERVMDCGASGYITRSCPVTELIEAIRTVARGGRHIGAEIAQQMALGMLPGSAGSPFTELSTREMEVMRMLAEGQRIPEIAQLMHLSPKTVATYKYRIFEKLHARNDVEMTRLAMRHGLVASA